MSKLTIKEEMRVLDCKDRDWWNSLTEEEQGKLSMWVLMRYCSSTQSNVKEINEHYLVMTNELVNVHFNLMRHHPELQHRLMQAVGIGTPQMHQWLAPGKRKGVIKNNKLMHAFYLELYPHLSDDEIVFVLTNMSKVEKTELLEDAGIDKKKVKDYLK